MLSWSDLISPSDPVAALQLRSCTSLTVTGLHEEDKDLSTLGHPDRSIPTTVILPELEVGAIETLEDCRVSLVAPGQEQ